MYGINNVGAKKNFFVFGRSTLCTRYAVRRYNAYTIPVYCTRVIDQPTRNRTGRRCVFIVLVYSNVYSPPRGLANARAIIFINIVRGIFIVPPPPLFSLSLTLPVFTAHYRYVIATDKVRGYNHHSSGVRAAFYEQALAYVQENSTLGPKLS